jgi:pimeloyl-ACP methyl ester carboxylesterase
LSTASAEPTFDLSEHCVFRRIGAAYLAKTRPVEPAKLQNWQPAPSFYGHLRRWLGALPGLRAREAAVDGHLIRYWELGARDKPPVVLVHGFSASKENWLNVIYLLSRRYRVFVPDVPGFGESSFDPAASYRMRAQGERIAAWFASLGAGSAHWVGSSMGGIIAGIAAAVAPEAVRSLTLMASAGVTGDSLSPFEQGLLDGRNGLIPENRAQVTDVMRLTTRARQWFHAASLPPLIAKDQIARAPVYHHLFREMVTVEDDPSPYWACFVQAPTLILWGDSDHVLHPCEADVLHRLIPGSNVHIMPGVGHLPMLEAPFRTARILREFWQPLD